MFDGKNLRKAYGGLQAVEGVSLHADQGEVVGLLGPNGAGKTTTIGMLAGLIAPDSGEVRLAGQRIQGDASQVKLQLGLVPQELALFEELTAEQNLNLFGALYGLSGARLTRERGRVLELVGLAERARDKAGAFIRSTPGVKRTRGTCTVGSWQNHRDGPSGQFQWAALCGTSGPRHPGPHGLYLQRSLTFLFD